MEKGKYNILNFKLYYIIQGVNLKKLHNICKYSNFKEFMIFFVLFVIIIFLLVIFFIKISKNDLQIDYNSKRGILDESNYTLNSI